MIINFQKWRREMNVSVEGEEILYINIEKYHRRGFPSIHSDSLRGVPLGTTTE